MKCEVENSVWLRCLVAQPDGCRERWLDEAELDWIAAQAESPELSDPILFFLPHEEREGETK